MKTLTKKQISNLNKIIQSNEDFIGTSVASIIKNNYSLTAEVLCHNKQATVVKFVTLNSDLQFISVNGSHSLPEYMKGSISIK